MYYVYRRKKREMNKTGNYMRFMCLLSLHPLQNLGILHRSFAMLLSVIRCLDEYCISRAGTIFLPRYIFPYTWSGPGSTDSNKTLRASRRANRATLRLRNLFFSWELASSGALSLSLSLCKMRERCALRRSCRVTASYFELTRGELINCWSTRSCSWIRNSYYAAAFIIKIGFNRRVHRWLPIGAFTLKLHIVIYRLVRIDFLIN